MHKSVLMSCIGVIALIAPAAAQTSQDSASKPDATSAPSAVASTAPSATKPTLYRVRPKEAVKLSERPSSRLQQDLATPPSRLAMATERTASRTDQRSMPT